jgi:Mg-chelatase subunit ChlD
MKTYKGYVFKQSVEQLIHKVAKSLGKDTTIFWTADISTAGINRHNHIYLSDVADDAILKHADLLKYCGYAVHELLHASFTNFSVEGDNDYIRSLHNAVEDAWIEHEGIKLSTVGNIENLLTTLIDGMVASAMGSAIDWSSPAQYPFALAVYLRNHAKNKVPLAQGLEPIFATAKSMLVNATSSIDTLNIAQYVFDQLNNLPPENKSSSASGGAKQPSADEMPADVEPMLEAPANTAGVGGYSDAKLAGKKHHVKTQSRPYSGLDSNVPAKLRYEVKRLLDDSGIEQFSRNKKSGSINVHDLPMANHKDRLFKRREEVEGIDTAISILIDVSGSMRDDGYDTNALITAIALLETLSKAHVATSIITFDTRSSVLKDFNDSPIKAKQDLHCANFGGGTNDYFAIRYAHKTLLNRHERRKICFVITDGEGWVDFARNQVEVGNRLGITTVGVGIGVDVSDVYDQSVLVTNVKDLGNVSFKQIKLAV